ncbi:hypothetical protein [Ideonella sp.]|uniref:hypothetical protein n=1 Tax=Ideonella sp. TaxID=1929293 RepID=UPI0035AE901F
MIEQHCGVQARHAAPHDADSQGAARSRGRRHPRASPAALAVEIFEVRVDSIEQGLSVLRHELVTLFALLSRGLEVF